MKCARYIVPGLSILLAGINAPAKASTVIDTIAGLPASPGKIWGFGEGSGETIGQTFVVPQTDNVLTSFTFLLADEDGQMYNAYGYNGVTKFDFIIMKWNGIKATGPLLFQSGPYSITTGNSNPTQFVFNTGNLSLTSDQQYVAFVTCSTELDGINDFATAIYASTSDGSEPYSGGTCVYLDSNADLTAFTATTWNSTFEGYPKDLAFRATFSSVPEPSTAGLLLAGFTFSLRRKR